MLPFSLSLAWFWGFLQRATPLYRQIYEKLYQYLKKNMITRGKALQIAQNQVNLREKYMVTHVVARAVTSSSYGNALQ